MTPEFREIGLLLIEITGVAAVMMFFGLLPKLKDLVPLQFKYPHREIRYAGVVVVGAFIIAVVVFWQSLGGAGSVGTVSEHSKQLTYAAIGALLLTIGVLRYRKQPFRSMGWNSALMGPAIQVGITMILMLLFLLGKMSRITAGIPEDVTRSLLWIILSAVALETVFRGYVQHRVESKLGFVPAWLITAVLFAVYYLITIWGAPEPELLKTGGIVLMRSLLAGWIFKKCPHALAPGIYMAAATWVSLF